MSFQSCAEAYIAAHTAGWYKPKHAAQWTSTLETFARPVIGSLPVSAVDTAMVTKIMEPTWELKTETASRVRGRIEAVLDWATVRSYRTGENPARWRGHLETLLPAGSKVQRVVHHPALPFPEVPAFLARFKTNRGIAAQGLILLILTAVRTGEAIGARWPEFDMTNWTWTNPAERMKAGQEHRVPLSDQAMEIVAVLGRTQVSEYVFPGQRPGRALSNMAFLQLLRRMRSASITAHGFRSSFRDWGAESTDHTRDVAEMALAHTIRGEVEAADRRGDLFAKRQPMQDWADFCIPQPTASDAAARP